MADGVKGTGATLLEQIGAMRDVAPPSARRIAKLITKEPMFAATSGIIELARASETSVGSINRFCRALGIAGYTELRLALAQEIGSDSAHSETSDPSGDIDPATSAADTIRIIAAASRKAISQTAELLDLHALDQLAAAVDSARLVQVVAYGGSGHVGTYLANQLTGIGVTCLTETDVNTAASYLATLGESDVVVALSHSGMARFAVELVEAAQAQGVITAAITSSAVSPLAKAVDISLVTTARTVSSRYRGTAGRHAQLFVTDALYVRVAQRRHQTANRMLDRAGQITAPYQLGPNQTGSAGVAKKSARKQRPEENA